MGSHVYWRIDVTANNGDSSLGINEIEMRATVGGADQCSGGTPSAVSYSGISDPSKAFDDNATGTAWLALSPATTGWIQYQFASAVAVEELALFAATTYAPKDFTFQYSDDGSVWYTAITVTGEIGWFSAGEWRNFVLPLDITEQDDINIAVLSSTAESVLHTPILEIESDSTSGLKLSGSVDGFFDLILNYVTDGLKLSGTEDPVSSIATQLDNLNALKLKLTADANAMTTQTLGGSFKPIGLSVAGVFLRNMSGSVNPIGLRVVGKVTTGQALDSGTFKPLGFQVTGVFGRFGGVVKVLGLGVTGAMSVGNLLTGSLKPIGLTVLGDIRTKVELSGVVSPLGLRVSGAIQPGMTITGAAGIIGVTVAGGVGSGNVISGSIGLILFQTGGNAMSSGSMSGSISITGLLVYGSYSRVLR